MICELYLNKAIILKKYIWISVQKLKYTSLYFWNRFFFSFLAALMAYGSFQARDGIWATAASYATAVATLGNLTLCATAGTPAV